MHNVLTGVALTYSHTLEDFLITFVYNNNKYNDDDNDVLLVVLVVVVVVVVVVVKRLRFNRAALNAGRSSLEKGVCRLSVKRVDDDKTEEKSVPIFITHERSFSLVFWGKECLVRATPST